MRSQVDACCAMPGVPLCVTDPHSCSCLITTTTTADPATTAAAAGGGCRRAAGRPWAGGRACRQRPLSEGCAVCWLLPLRAEGGAHQQQVRPGGGRSHAGGWQEGGAAAGKVFGGWGVCSAAVAALEPCCCCRCNPLSTCDHTKHTTNASAGQGSADEVCHTTILPCHTHHTSQPHHWHHH